MTSRRPLAGLTGDTGVTSGVKGAGGKGSSRRRAVESACLLLIDLGGVGGGAVAVVPRASPRAAKSRCG